MGVGFLSTETFTGNRDLPVSGADIEISDKNGNILYQLTSDSNGLTDYAELAAPEKDMAYNPNLTDEDYFSVYEVRVSREGYRPVVVSGVQIFDRQQSYLPVNLYPLPRGVSEADAVVYNVEPPACLNNDPRDQENGGVSQRILRDVVIPDFITVHLGLPNVAARRVRVPFIDYLKNVASSEIFPDWPEASLEANILAQITFALNRIYTEWYTVRGHNFNITNSTHVDQAFFEGRNIFRSVAAIVDRIFYKYVRRQGFKEPYFTEYCSGRTVTCPGMKQWDTVDLALRGFTPLNILKHFYPNDIQIVDATRFSGVLESFPGYVLSIGSVGEPVQTMQIFLNRISADFPLIRPISNPNGVFGIDTQQAVKVFQRTFGLAEDGVIGRATWNYISRIYGAVKRLSELGIEGQRIGIGAAPPAVTVRQGSKGENVVQLQFLLNAIAAFYSSVPPVLETGTFDNTTAQSVIEFQRQFGLSTDAVVGSTTWSKLYDVYRGIINNTPGPQPPPAAEDYPGNPIRRGS
ncbi:MAG: peptidoglycan-binding protein, partial [Defluviitaleaceae bacterium]|nr:peptidoglycan-binding protein [Defluviitaleaceae bacterium]